MLELIDVDWTYGPKWFTDIVCNQTVLTNCRWRCVGGYKKITVACVKYCEVHLAIGFLHSNDQYTFPTIFYCEAMTLLVQVNQFVFEYTASCIVLIMAVTAAQNFVQQVHCVRSLSQSIKGRVSHHWTMSTWPRQVKGQWVLWEVNHSTSFKNHTSIIMSIPMVYNSVSEGGIFL